MIVADLCCPQCDALMVQTSEDYLCCPNGHGRLRTAPKKYAHTYKLALKLKEFPANTPSAVHCGLGWYTISGLNGRYRIKLTAGGEKVDPKKCPDGCLVAIYCDKPHVFRRGKE